jgi:hypothetical protein
MYEFLLFGTIFVVAQGVNFAEIRIVCLWQAQAKEI